MCAQMWPQIFCLHIPTIGNCHSKNHLKWIFCDLCQCGPWTFDFDYTMIWHRYVHVIWIMASMRKSQPRLIKKIVVSGCNQCHPHGFFLSPSRLTIVQRWLNLLWIANVSAYKYRAFDFTLGCFSIFSAVFFLFIIFLRDINWGKHARGSSCHLKVTWDQNRHWDVLESLPLPSTSP